jgi:hypothetical protein
VLLPLVRKALREARAPAVELRATGLGSDAALIGAVRLVLDRMDTELFGPLVSSAYRAPAPQHKKGSSR